MSTTSDRRAPQLFPQVRPLTIFTTAMAAILCAVLGFAVIDFADRLSTAQIVLANAQGVGSVLARISGRLGLPARTPLPDHVIGNFEVPTSPPGSLYASPGYDRDPFPFGDPLSPFGVPFDLFLPYAVWLGTALFVVLLTDPPFSRVAGSWSRAEQVLRRWVRWALVSLPVAALLVTVSGAWSWALVWGARELPRGLPILDANAIVLPAAAGLVTHVQLMFSLARMACARGLLRSRRPPGLWSSCVGCRYPLRIWSDQCPECGRLHAGRETSAALTPLGGWLSVYTLPALRVCISVSGLAALWLAPLILGLAGAR